MPLDPDGAAELINAGRHDLAERELRRYLAAEPQHGAAHALLATALIAQGQGMAALTALREASRLDPDHPWTVQARVEVHVRMRHRVEGEVALGEALARFPNEPIYHARMATALLNHPGLGNGRASGALAAADTGLALDPNNAECMRQRAQALLLLGRKREAGEAAEEALRLAPGDAASHVVHGRVRMAMGKRHRAAAWASLRESLRINPNDEYARAHLREAEEWLRLGVAIPRVMEHRPVVFRSVTALTTVAVAASVARPRWDVTVLFLCYALFGLVALEAMILPVRFGPPERVAELRHPGELTARELREAAFVLWFCLGFVGFALVGAALA
ncbi:MAG TPA: tetratricopeptide repeat protein [Longimicrobium sp.]|nr:tetratricopeptide repeat protein [Longimicrobium sp.]